VRITTEVEVDVDPEELLEEIDDKTLLDELERRKHAPIDCGVSLLTIFEEFQRRGDAPQCLKDYLYAHLGRVL
jgi:hypothetical protein